MIRASDALFPRVAIRLSTPSPRPARHCVKRAARRFRAGDFLNPPWPGPEPGHSPPNSRPRNGRQPACEQRRFEADGIIVKPEPCRRDVFCGFCAVLRPASLHPSSRMVFSPRPMAGRLTIFGLVLDKPGMCSFGSRASGPAWLVRWVDRLEPHSARWLRPHRRSCPVARACWRVPFGGLLSGASVSSDLLRCLPGCVGEAFSLAESELPCHGKPAAACALSRLRAGVLVAGEQNRRVQETIQAQCRFLSSPTRSNGQSPPPVLIADNTCRLVPPFSTPR